MNDREKKSAAVLIRMDADMREALEIAARAQGRPVAQLIRFVMANWIKAEYGGARPRVVTTG